MQLFPWDRKDLIFIEISVKFESHSLYPKSIKIFICKEKG